MSEKTTATQNENEAKTRSAAKDSFEEQEIYERRKMRFTWPAKVKWLWSFYMQFKYVLTVLLTLTAAHAATIVVQPVIFRNIFDSLRNGPESLNSYDDPITVFLVNSGWTTPKELAVVFILFAALSFLIYLVVQNHRAWMNCRLEMEFRQRVFGDIATYGPRFYGKFNVGDLVTRLTDDVAEKLSWFACSGIFRFYEALILLVFGLSVMITLNPKLTLYTMAPLPILVFLFRASSSRLDRRYDYLQSRISRLNDMMEACFSGIRVVKAYRQEKAQRNRFSSAVTDRRNAEVSAVKAQTIIEAFYMYVWEFGLVLALVVGGYMVIQGEITLGEYLAFDFFVMLMIMPMLDIGQFLVKGLQSAVSIDRLMELQSYKNTRSVSGDKSTPEKLDGKLTFENVTLSLDGTRNIIDDVSFTIKPGATVALAGQVGSGKSWAVNLIPRLIDPDSGLVKLDGIALTEFKIDELRGLIGYVSQEPALFSDTIENNVLFGRKDISDEDMQWAIDISQLRTEIGRFPKGLQTPVGTRGLTLSGGQKQRVAMARALVTKPRILILDDCTSALDAQTEDQLWEALANLPYQTTTLIITHRTATLRNVDRILVFKNGKVIEDGSHRELIASESLYAELYRTDELAEQV
jgi:ATP-binding cassette subfamily B protein